MPVVTLSRQLGSLGDEIAVGVAQALSLRLVNRETINSAALQAGVPRMALQELEYEGQRGLVELVLDVLRATPAIPATPEMTRRDSSTVAVPFGGLFSPAMPPLSIAMENYVRVVGMMIKNLAREGDVLIIGRGGQMLLKGWANTLHVQVAAPFERRVERLMEREGLARRQSVRYSFQRKARRCGSSLG